MIFLISLKDLKLGLLAALTELFIGAQGHLFNLNIGNFAISIRIGIFTVVMLAWLIWTIRKKTYRSTVNLIKSHKELIYLAAICLWALAFALFRQNSLKDIFLDFNAWLYFLYFLPFLTIFKTQKHLNQILQVFTASIIAISLKSIFILFIFSHKLSILRDFYRWGRDTRWGEFTLLSNNFYRIFSQSQIFILIGFFILLSYLFFKGKSNYRVKNNQYLSVVLFLLLSTIILSLSRSYWVGLFLGFILLLIVATFIVKQKKSRLAALIIRLTFITLLSYALIITIINIPISFGNGFSTSGSMITDRISISDNAVSSRWSQLPKLSKKIIKHPIIGSGWGTTVTYQSQDPRILNEENPHGWYTTYAFEWGYLDFLLKIGLLGLIIYLTLLISIFKKLWDLHKKNTDRYVRALILGLMFGLFSLIIVHGFSPYLNHPLGIGYLLILLTLIPILHPKTEPTKS